METKIDKQLTIQDLKTKNISLFKFNNFEFLLQPNNVLEWFENKNILSIKIKITKNNENCTKFEKEDTPFVNFFPLTFFYYFLEIVILEDNKNIKYKIPLSSFNFFNKNIIQLTPPIKPNYWTIDLNNKLEKKDYENISKIKDEFINKISNKSLYIVLKNLSNYICNEYFLEDFIQKIDGEYYYKLEETKNISQKFFYVKMGEEFIIPLNSINNLFYNVKDAINPQIGIYNSFKFLKIKQNREVFVISDIFEEKGALKLDLNSDYVFSYYLDLIFFYKISKEETVFLLNQFKEYKLNYKNLMNYVYKNNSYFSRKYSNTFKGVDCLKLKEPFVDLLPLCIEEPNSLNIALYCFLNNKVIEDFDFKSSKLEKDLNFHFLKNIEKEIIVEQNIYDMRNINNNEDILFIHKREKIKYKENYYDYIDFFSFENKFDFFSLKKGFQIKDGEIIFNSYNLKSVLNREFKLNSLKIDKKDYELIESNIDKTNILYKDENQKYILKVKNYIYFFDLFKKKYISFESKNQTKPFINTFKSKNPKVKTFLNISDFLGFDTNYFILELDEYVVLTPIGILCGLQLEKFDKQNQPLPISPLLPFQSNSNYLNIENCFETNEFIFVKKTKQNSFFLPCYILLDYFSPENNTFCKIENYISCSSIKTLSKNNNYSNILDLLDFSTISNKKDLKKIKLNTLIKDGSRRIYRNRYFLRINLEMQIKHYEFSSGIISTEQNTINVPFFGFNEKDEKRQLISLILEANKNRIKFNQNSISFKKKVNFFQVYPNIFDKRSNKKLYFQFENEEKMDEIIENSNLNLEKIKSDFFENFTFYKIGEKLDKLITIFNNGDSNLLIEESLHLENIRNISIDKNILKTNKQYLLKENSKDNRILESHLILNKSHSIKNKKISF